MEYDLVMTEMNPLAKSGDQRRAKKVKNKRGEIVKLDCFKTSMIQQKNVFMFSVIVNIFQIYLHLYYEINYTLRGRPTHSLMHVSTGLTY